jgi:hypothetical protein
MAVMRAPVRAGNHSDLSTLRTLLRDASKAALGGGPTLAFYPFGAIIAPDEDVFFVTGTAAPDPTKIEPVLLQVIMEIKERTALGVVRAAGICMLVKELLPGAEERVAAVMIHVEANGGSRERIFVPYSRRRILGLKYRSGDPDAGRAVALQVNARTPHVKVRRWWPSRASSARPVRG